MSLKSHIWNTSGCINFTVTFHPHRFTKEDSIYTGQLFFINKMNMILSKWAKKGTVHWYFVSEEMKNGYKHMHGQVFYAQAVGVIKSYTDEYQTLLISLSGICNKYIGNSVFKCNNPVPTEDSEYPTYMDYCFKEATIYYYNGYDGVPAEWLVWPKI